MYIIGAEIYPVKRDKAKKRYFCTVKVKKTVTLRCGRMVFNDRNENVRLRAVDAVKSIHNGIEAPKARMRRTAGAAEGDSPFYGREGNIGKNAFAAFRRKRERQKVLRKRIRRCRFAGMGRRKVREGFGTCAAREGNASCGSEAFRPFERLMRDTAIACWQSVRPLW